MNIRIKATGSAFSAGETGPLLGGTQDSDDNTKLRTWAGTTLCNVGWALLARKDLCTMTAGGPGGQAEREFQRDGLAKPANATGLRAQKRTQGAEERDFPLCSASGDSIWSNV